MEIYPSINVFGKELETCCNNPKTGFFRNGICDTCHEDFGVHTICILATALPPQTGPVLELVL